LRLFEQIDVAAVRDLVAQALAVQLLVVADCAVLDRRQLAQLAAPACWEIDDFARLRAAHVLRRDAQSFELHVALDEVDVALAHVNLLEAGDRKVAAYSKGMRQRIRLAQAIAHEPRVLILDEPLNGLDPMVRAETIALFRKFAAEGFHLIISSHILHEVDMMSDRVVLLNNGYIVAEGNIHGVRDEMEEHPMQILIRCDNPSKLAAYVFEQDHVVEARLHDDRRGLFIRTRDADRFYLLLNQVVAEGEINVESIAPVDDDLSAVYQYLIGTTGGSA